MNGKHDTKNNRYTCIKLKKKKKQQHFQQEPNQLITAILTACACVRVCVHACVYVCVRASTREFKEMTMRNPRESAQNIQDKMAMHISTVDTTRLLPCQLKIK